MGDTPHTPVNGSHPSLGRSLAAAALVLVGAASASASNIINIEDLNGVDGFAVQGPEDIGFGQVLGSVGDINGDGFDDFGFGVPYLGGTENQVGGVYILFGAESFPSTVSFQSPDGSDGFVLEGEVVAGWSLAAAGDVNADGYDDFITGAPGLNYRGRAYIVYGHAPPYPATVRLGEITDGIGATQIDCAPLNCSGVALGWSVSGLGDVNGDGIDDIAVGATVASSPSGSGRGAAYVIYGRSGGLGDALSVASLDGSNGFAFYSTVPNARAGYSVAGGDVNGDGLADLIVGAPGYNLLGDDRGGVGYVVFGQRDPFPVWFDDGSLDGSNGFVVKGPTGGSYDALLGIAVAASDLNGDGRAEIILGAPNAEEPVDDDLVGAVFVIWGRADDYPARFAATGLDGNDGFAFYGYTADGGQNGNIGGRGSLAGSFDFDADGREDLVLGNPYLSIGAQRTGEGYLVFGQAGGYSGPHQWVEELNEMTGLFVRWSGFLGFFGDRVAALGDVNADGGDDVMFARYSAPDARVFVILGYRGREIFSDGFESGTVDGWSWSQ